MRRLPHLSLTAVMILGSTVLTGCRLGFDREAMLGRIADTVILPAHLTLTEEARDLDEVTRRFTDEPSAATLETLREQWLATELAWKRVELYEFPGLLLIHNAIERRPGRVAFIEEVIAGADDSALGQVNGEFVESLGSTSKGLSAIEYLIFPAEEQAQPVLESFADPARSAYLTALTANLRSKTQDLYRFWGPDGENYAESFRKNDSEGADIQGSVSLLANELIELHEVLMHTKLGMPMGQTTDGIPQPKEVESYLSGRSLELMTANLESLRRTFDAGLDDYLDYLDRRSTEALLSMAIHAQLGTVLDALGNIDGPLQDAVTGVPMEVERTYEAMRFLLVLLKTDMSALLGITVTFGDADGD